MFYSNKYYSTSGTRDWTIETVDNNDNLGYSHHPEPDGLRYRVRSLQCKPMSGSLRKLSKNLSIRSCVSCFDVGNKF